MGFTPQDYLFFLGLICVVSAIGLLVLWHDKRKRLGS